MYFSRPTGESLCEPPLESAKDCKPASDWPQKGRIEFRNLTMRYFANEPAVLKDLNFTIQAGDKIGIVGKPRQLSALSDFGLKLHV